MLLSLSKIYECIIFSYLQKYLKTKVRPNYISLNHLTILLLVKFTHQLSENYNNDVQITSIFLDIERTLDRAFFKKWLLSSLLEITKIIESFLTDQAFKTEIKNIFSTNWLNLEKRLQGSSLLLLFICCQWHD